MNLKRLIELLTKEVNRFWFEEMTTHLNDEEAGELDDLLHEYEQYKKDKNPPEIKAWQDPNEENYM